MSLAYYATTSIQELRIGPYPNRMTVYDPPARVPGYAYAPEPLGFRGIRYALVQAHRIID